MLQPTTPVRVKPADVAVLRMPGCAPKVRRNHWMAERILLFTDMTSGFTLFCCCATLSLQSVGLLELAEECDPKGSQEARQEGFSEV